MASSSSDDEKVYVDDRYVDAMEMYRNAQKDFTELLKELRDKIERGAITKPELRSPAMSDDLNQRYPVLIDPLAERFEEVEALCVRIRAFHAIVQMEREMIRAEAKDEV